MEKILKDGSTRVTEWELREIDEYGDSIDPQHFGNRKEAKEAFDKWEPNDEAKAAVLERHRSWFKTEGGDFIDDEYEKKGERGSESALAAGGWTE